VRYRSSWSSTHRARIQHLAGGAAADADAHRRHDRLAVLTTRADRIGRRRMLLLGAVLMIAAGVLFALTRNFPLLVVVATIGVISPSGNEVGPFLRSNRRPGTRCSGAPADVRVRVVHVDRRARDSRRLVGGRSHLTPLSLPRGGIAVCGVRCGPLLLFHPAVAGGRGDGREREVALGIGKSRSIVLKLSRCSHSTPLEEDLSSRASPPTGSSCASA